MKKSKTLQWALCVAAVLALTVGIRALAQNETLAHFNGVINDYSPIAGGTTAWEVRGPWNLMLNEETGTANFSAALTMELSVLGQSPATVQAVALNQHTHHIKMTGAIVTYNPTDCPLPASVTPIARIEVKGMATVTANGGPFPPSSPISLPLQLQVCIDGGTSAETIVPYSKHYFSVRGACFKSFRAAGGSRRGSEGKLGELLDTSMKAVGTMI